MSTEHNPDNLTPEHNPDGPKLSGRRYSSIAELREMTEGHFCEKRCPKCNASLLRNKLGEEWCSFIECDFGIEQPRITPDAGKAEAQTLILEETPELQSAEALREYKERTKDVHIGKYGAPAQQPAQEPCLTCEGHGIIGGYEGSGNDMSPVGYPCPDCNPPAQQPAEAMPETETPEQEDIEIVRRRIKETYSALHVNPSEISEGLARDIIRVAQKGGDEACDAWARIERRLTAALAEVERLKIQVEVGHIASLNLKTAEQECQRLTDELSTERAAREQAEKERDELKAECERLAAIIDKDFDKVTQLNLKSLNLDENGLNMHMQAEVIPMFGALLAAILDAGKAENYVECRIDTPRHGPCVMTFQKVLGKTPHQLRESAEHERDSLAERLAESESREHQLREVLKDADQCIDRLSRTIANKGQRDDEETRWARNREACETGDRITAALATPASTTVADLRKRAETAERERDAAVKDTKRLDWLENTKAECYSVEGKEQAEGSKLWKIAGKNGFHVTLRAAIDAALATTQETK